MTTNSMGLPSIAPRVSRSLVMLGFVLAAALMASGISMQFANLP